MYIANQLTPILDTVLANLHGGMFAPFINTYSNDPAKQVPSGAKFDTSTLGKEIVKGAVTAGLGASCATKDPRIISTASVGGGLAYGMEYSLDNLHLPSSQSINLTTCLRPYGSKPTWM